MDWKQRSQKMADKPIKVRKPNPIRLRTPETCPQFEAERKAEAERKNRRRLERELKKLGWNSIEEFEADVDELDRRFLDNWG